MAGPAEVHFNLALRPGGGQNSAVVIILKALAAQAEDNTQ